ncbi:pleckstrin-like domain containing family A member 8 [Sarotherodon galilaeus]
MCTLTQRPQSSIMMERIWLGIFYRFGWHISTCLSFQYHFVADYKTWTDAQTYCRQTYTDLVTIQNAEEMNQLIKTVSSASLTTQYVWIGLYSEIDWMWSNGYTGTGADYKSWSSTEPNFYDENEFCVVIEQGGLWYNYFCSSENPFICYNGTQLNPEFVFVNQKMNLSNAQSYCRENYIDLATVTSSSENQVVQSFVPNNDWAWIGLFRNPNFFWSDGSSFIYSNFGGGENQIGSMKVICGFASLSNSGKWKFWSCNSVLPFVCYSNSPAPLQSQVLKLRINMQPSLELNLTVQEDLLKMFQYRLKEKGVNGVTLKWTELSDGEVYQKEEHLTITQNMSCKPIC